MNAKQILLWIGLFPFSAVVALAMVSGTGDNAFHTNRIQSADTPGDSSDSANWYLPYVVVGVGERHASSSNNVVTFSRNSRSLDYPCILEFPEPTKENKDSPRSPVPEFQGRVLFCGDNDGNATEIIRRLNEGNTNKRPILLYIHGFTVPPETTLNKAAEYNARPNRTYAIGRGLL